MKRLIPLAVAAMLSTVMVAAAANSSTSQKPVIEVVTLKIKPGVDVKTFRKADHAVEVGHVAKQPGFLSRESAAGADRSWVVIVHWRSVDDAQASMNSFADAAAADEFMSLIEPDTMVMTRYGG